jgi:hypothetical protein
VCTEREREREKVIIQDTVSTETTYGAAGGCKLAMEIPLLQEILFRCHCVHYKPTSDPGPKLGLDSGKIVTA